MGEEQKKRNPREIIVEREFVVPPEKLVSPIPEPPEPPEHKEGKDD